jgi:epsilon-lactone hydrolase
MSSKQSEAASKLYPISVTEAARRPDWAPEDQREPVETRRGTSTGEPWGVDDIDVDAGGVPRMRLNPPGAPADHALFGIRREGHS